MIAAWMLQSGQPADATFDGGPLGTLGRIRAGIELSVADTDGRTVTRRLDYYQAIKLQEALAEHVRNVAPRTVHPPR
jgi:hypothetical protein